MIDRVYCSGLFSANFLEHSYKGTEWKDHKYIKKENGRYYYPDEKTGGADSTSSRYSKMDVDQLQEEYNIIKKNQEEYYNKAQEMDEIAKTSDQPEYYRKLASEYRSKVEALGRESITVGNLLNQKTEAKQKREEFLSSPIDYMGKKMYENRRKLHTGNPIVRMKH